MTTTSFLEQLAQNTFYSDENQQLIGVQSEKIQDAFLENKSEVLKHMFSGGSYLADGLGAIENEILTNIEYLANGIGVIEI